MTPTAFQQWFIGGQFSSLEEPYVQAFLDRASTYVDDVNAWGKRYTEALANCAAHMIVIDQAETAQAIDQVDADDGVVDSIGPISSRRSEKVVEWMAKDQFMRTSYGRKYVDIRDLIGLGGSCG